MLETEIWVFLGMMALVAVAIPIVVRQMRKRAVEQVAKAFASLAATGVVVEDALNQHGRQIVRIWGTLDHPVSLDLRISPRGKILGQLGKGSTGALDSLFDGSFRILSREPERALLIVSPEIQLRLAQLGKLEFRIGSFDSLLPPDYRQAEQTKAERQLRRLWMIRVPMKRRTPAAREGLAEVGRLLAKSIAKHCRPPGTTDLREFRTSRAEGQWL